MKTKTYTIKKLNLMVIAAMILSSLMLFNSGCKKDNSEDSISPNAPWENQFLIGNFMINGIDVLTHQDSETNEHVIDRVCYSSLPTGSLETFSINIYIPKHDNPDYQSGLYEQDMRVFFGGATTPKIYLSGSLKYLGTNEINGITYSKFIIGGVFSGSNSITKDNFQQYRIDFDMAYIDDNGSEIYNSPKAISINISDC